MVSMLYLSTWLAPIITNVFKIAHYNVGKWAGQVKIRTYVSGQRDYSQLQQLIEILIRAMIGVVARITSMA